MTVVGLLLVEALLAFGSAYVVGRFLFRRV